MSLLGQKSQIKTLLKNVLALFAVLLLVAIGSISLKAQAKEKSLMEFTTPASTPSVSIDGTPGCVEVKLKAVADNKEKLYRSSHDPTALTYSYSIKIIRSQVEEEQACVARIVFKGTWHRPSDMSDHVDQLIIEIPSMNRTETHSRVGPSI